MLFDLTPKAQVKDIYDRHQELKQLSDSLRRKERLIVVYGLRRVGKTSLIHSTLSTRDFFYIFIDVKEIFFTHGSVPLGAFSELIASEFLRFTEKLGIGEDAAAMPTGGRDGLTELLKDINEWCKSKGVFFVIALDEAQYLRYGGRVRYDGIIAWIVDNLTNIGFILTGSEIGVLKEFLKYENPDAPLYGRFRSEIYLERFDIERSKGFLEKGFGEYEKKVKGEEIDDAASRIGGIVGWLTYYGYYRVVSGLSHEQAMDRVFDEGSRIVAKEIDGLISKSRRRYAYTLRAIASDIDTWAEIKSYVSAKSGLISDTVLSSLLQSLVKLGIVEKTIDGRYIILDPIVLHVAKRIKP